MRIAAVLLVAAVLAPAASAKGRVVATLTRPIPAGAQQGGRIVVAFELRDRQRRPVVTGPVWVKLICPTRDAFRRTLAYAKLDGSYRAVATVPPGGFGTLQIGFGSQRVEIANPPHR